MKSISKDIPLNEITLRRYERPANLDERELARKICLSLGLLQPGDSRDVIVDILHALLRSRKEGRTLTSGEVLGAVIEERKRLKLPMVGIASSNVRRQLRRLKDLFLVEKRGKCHRIAENSRLLELFEERIERYLLPSINSRIKEYLKKMDDALL